MQTLADFSTPDGEHISVERDDNDGSLYLFAFFDDGERFGPMDVMHIPAAIQGPLARVLGEARV